MVSASRGEWIWAGWFIVIAGVLDLLDGRIARFTRTGSAFGGELDSLVDAISFGVAPAFIVYRLHFADASWSWLLSFAYITAVVVRLARFNVEQGGEAKAHFHGLPSTTGGMILATFHPFSQTAFFQENLSGLPAAQILAVVMILLSALMLSHVPYPVVPRIGWRTARSTATTVAMGAMTVAALTVPRHFFFPFLMLYAMWGLARSVLLGLVERLPERDPLMDEGEMDEGGAELRSLDYREIAPSRYFGPHTDDDETRERDP